MFAVVTAAYTPPPTACVNNGDTAPSDTLINTIDGLSTATASRTTATTGPNSATTGPNSATDGIAAATLSLYAMSLDDDTSNLSRTVDLEHQTSIRPESSINSLESSSQRLDSSSSVSGVMTNEGDRRLSGDGEFPVPVAAIKTAPVSSTATDDLQAVLERSGDSDDSTDEESRCAVCFLQMVHPVRLPCSHVFCFLCVKVREGGGRSQQFWLLSLC